MQECNHRRRIGKYKNAIIQECGPLALQQTQSINISENRDMVTMVEFQHKAVIRGNTVLRTKQLSRVHKVSSTGNSHKDRRITIIIV